MPPLSIISVTLIIGFLFFKHLANRGIAQVNAETAREMIKDPGIAVLDVRTPPQYRRGHIHVANLKGGMNSRVGKGFMVVKGS